MGRGQKFEEINISDLVPYERNSRTHSDNQIAKIQASIREFGFIRPVLIDYQYNVIAGHGSMEAAKREGMQKIPCVFIEGLSEAQRRAYIITDNRLALDADWDMDALRMELDDLQSLSLDLSITGFEDNEIEAMFKSDGAAEEDDYDVDAALEEIVEPRTKPGFIWQLGRHRLLCGDSTKGEELINLMDGASADMFLTDPPYNVDYEGKTEEALKIQNDSMPDDEFRQFLIDAFSAADSVMRQGAAFYIWHSDSEGYNFRAACFEIGWQVRQCLIWNKNSMVMGRQDYQWKHEPCLYGWKPGAGHLWTGDRKQTTVIDFERPFRNADHPTMKPIGLFDYQIMNNTKSGDIVLDSFAGSGTTIMACEQNGRTAYCVELSEKYCDVIVDRWEKLTGEKAVLLIT